MRKPPKFPVYDPARDGNPFQWILAQSAALHEQQRAAAMQPRPRIDPLTGRPYLAPVKRNLSKEK
jgi:hypothetical protein